MNFNNAQWLNKPKQFNISEDRVNITTSPGTDFWQRSYYGFQNNNAPALLLNSNDNFTFTTKANFNYKKQFDQCGLIIYLNNENWFKASIEYENDDYSRLGSVVTNFGYSDWATTDIKLPTYIWYRLSRRGPDFLIESSTNGIAFNQMRVFHLHLLGKTTKKMGKANPPLPSVNSVCFGIYACSPLDSSFNAEFCNFRLEQCKWMAHSVN